jgi:hypothetical protein
VFLAAPELAEESAEGAAERVTARPHPDVKAQADPLTTR